MEYYPSVYTGLLLYEDEVENLCLDEDLLNQFSGVSGDFTTFTDGCEDKSFYEDSFFMLRIDREADFFSQAYADYAEMKAEIVEKLGTAADALPFDIDSRIGTFTGTIFG